MTNKSPSKQEYYYTLSQSLDFFHAKTMDLEAFFDTLNVKCEIFDYQQLAKRLKKFNYKEELSPEELQIAENLTKEAGKHSPINKDALIKEIRDSFKQLKALYLKQIGIMEDLEEFAKKEKFNNNVNIDMKIEHLTLLKKTTFEIIEKRAELKDILLSNLADEKYDK